METTDAITVSIVIPCYNAEKYIGAALQSALDQTFPVAEIIVVNDGSTDGSLAIIEQFAHDHPPRVRVISQENGGAGVARTVGVKAARTPYVLPLDADDVLHPEAVATLAEYAVQHPEFAAIYCDYFVMNAEGDLTGEVSIGKRRSDPLEGHILPTILWENVASACSLVRRDKVIEVGGYFIKLEPTLVNSFEDVFIYLRLLAAGHLMGYVQRPLFYYREHADGLSKDKARVHEAMQHAFSHLFKKAPEVMAEAFLTMRQWRAEQLRDTFDALDHRAPANDDSAQIAQLQTEIDLLAQTHEQQYAEYEARLTTLQAALDARDEAALSEQAARLTQLEAENDALTSTVGELDQSLTQREASIQELLSEIERARVYQEGLLQIISDRERRINEYLAEIERARVYQETIHQRLALRETLLSEVNTLLTRGHYQFEDSNPEIPANNQEVNKHGT